jgi:hypothetical protein
VADEPDLARKREMLVTLDATIQLLKATANPDLVPSICPTRAACSFAKGNKCGFVSRRCEGQSAHDLPVRSARMRCWPKGLPADNVQIVNSIRVPVRMALGRLEAKGTVRRIISAPDTWWELAG